MSDLPYAFDISIADKILSRYDNHIIRKLSGIKNQFADQQACEEILAQEDVIVYEVFELRRPEVAGELWHGLSIVHPGKIGEEYYMTKGHFHSVLETAEVYYCLRGEGVMVMETLEGDWTVEPLYPNRVLYVPPTWAHRSVNTNPNDALITFFVYPGNAGHNYGAIEVQGFRKLILERNGIPEIIDNPRWIPPKKR